MVYIMEYFTTIKYLVHIITLTKKKADYTQYIGYIS